MHKPGLGFAVVGATLGIWCLSKGLLSVALILFVLAAITTAAASDRFGSNEDRHTG